MAALHGLDEEVCKFASMRLWLDWAGVVAVAEAGANGSGPEAIRVETETF